MVDEWNYCYCYPTVFQGSGQAVQLEVTFRQSASLQLTNYQSILKIMKYALLQRKNHRQFLTVQSVSVNKVPYIYNSAIRFTLVNKNIIKHF
jgi:hypothetical protein